MRQTLRTFLTAGLLVLVCGEWQLTAQVRSYTPGAYRAPRYPQLKANYTLDELAAMADELVRRPPQAAFLTAGYGIRPGHRALIVVGGDFDDLVLKAIVRAIQKAGGSADVVKRYGNLPDPNYRPIEHAYREANGLARPSDDPTGAGGAVAGEGGPALPGGGGIAGRTIFELAENKGYSVLIYGSGGPHNPIKIPWNYIFWDTLDKFVTSVSFPMEVQNAIDQAAWALATQGVKFHATDPEGTDITWTVRPQAWEEAKKTYGFNIVHEGHLSPMPLGMGIDSFMANDATGVIAGTLNHAGPFPHLRVNINKGSMSASEGGGRYGQLINMALDKWKNTQLPGHPGPGINKLWEVAIGTNPKGIRTKNFAEVGGSWERSRSGVIHWGMGSRTGFVMEKLMPTEWSEFHAKNDVPSGHLHIHTYFTTLDVTTASGQVLRLLDKGRLTVLDDPKVRQVAAKYGDPDVLLQEVWIPAMPGINVPGNYMEDYGRDPVSYIKKEIAENYKY
ncbi:MAG TPA: hypothetical protein VNN17_05600 [Terriglobia bacterium]|nr:hypothetical protein [Terriglobia bacterium]